MNNYPQPKRLPPSPLKTKFEFSFCTLVTKQDQYSTMLESCNKAGFDEGDCEFLCIDNSESNQLDAYEAINRFLDESRGRYIVICHQDVSLIDPRSQLEQKLTELSAVAPDWAVAGNAGGINLSTLALRISDFAGPNQKTHDFPVRVESLDENFLVVNSNARIAVSADLQGFHFYGADLCIVADVLGYSCWVIDYHLNHYGMALSGNNTGRVTPFFLSKEALIGKYKRAFRSRYIRTTCAKLFIGGKSWLHKLYSSERFVKLATRRHKKKQGM